MTRTVGSRVLRWRDHGDGKVLCAGATVLLHIVPDDRFPGMWRIRDDVRLSDMVNLTRAKDAALRIVLAKINGEETALAAPLVQKSRAPVSEAA